MITAKEIVLRAPLPGDLRTLREIRKDREVQAVLLGHPEARSEEDDTENWLARRLHDSAGRFLVVDNDGDCIGFVQLTGRHRLDRHAHFGIALHPRAQGKGGGTAAMRLLLEYAAGLGLHKLLCEVRADNAAALSLYRRLGFRDVGTLAMHYDDGERRWDVTLLELILTDIAAS